MNKIDFKPDKIVYPFNMTGKESVIYLYKSETGLEDVLLKYFRDEYTEEYVKRQYQITGDYDEYMGSRGKIVTPERLENKRRKLQVIPHVPELSGEVNILNMVYADNSFKGYTMEKENLKPFDCLTKKKKAITFLKALREKIEILNNCGIFIGDFNTDNFLVSEDCEILKLCDLDNLKYGDLDFDMKHNFIKYYEKTGARDDYIDSFCFNLLTIAILSRKVNDLGFLFNSKLPKEINTHENQEIYDSINHLDSSYEYKFLIDNLR